MTQHEHSTVRHSTLYLVQHRRALHMERLRPKKEGIPSPGSAALGISIFSLAGKSSTASFVIPPYSVSSLVVPKMEEGISGTGAMKNSK